MSDWSGLTNWVRRFVGRTKDTYIPPTLDEMSEAVSKVLKYCHGLKACEDARVASTVLLIGAAALAGDYETREGFTKEAGVLWDAYQPMRKR